jgi:hypothetical protein
MNSIKTILELIIKENENENNHPIDTDVSGDAANAA